MVQKSTPEEIRARFDADVERFSSLETAQSSTIDAPLVLDLVTEAAAAACPKATSVLDVGCGAGNYTLKLLARLPGLECTLLDLSSPMLERARQRVEEETPARVETIQGDVRDVELGENRFDIIVAAAVLHHLRRDEEWESVFSKLYRGLRPSGTLWISDLVVQDNPEIHLLMWRRYGEYLSELRNEAYRDHVFAYIEREDTPRSLNYQLDLMGRTGFVGLEVLHKNGPFAAFGGRKKP